MRAYHTYIIYIYTYVYVYVYVYEYVYVYVYAYAYVYVSVYVYEFYYTIYCRGPNFKNLEPPEAAKPCWTIVAATLVTVARGPNGPR